jgi:eukaryotic-like serine/threonine-protein kinase
MTPGPPTEYEHLRPEEAARVDSLCDAFERAWKAAKAGGDAPRIASFLGPRGGPEQTILIRELIALDRACRERYGVPVRPEDYEDLGAAAETRATPGPPADLPDTANGTPGRPEHWPKIPGLEFLEVLGSGGMGVVFKARQPALGRTVAVKLLRDDTAGDPGRHDRFVQEARAVARLQHPHLVQLHEFGEAPGAGGATSRPYLVLEYVPGGNLADLLRGSPQPPAEAAQLVETLADAIDHAHQQGVIHRDLKPANVLLARRAGARDGGPGKGATNPPHPSPLALHRPKITDFGLAKFQADSDLTHTGDVLGTPSYMAPEQASGKSGVITAAVDVYGLGALLYEALTGRPPFMAETAAATVLQVLQADPVPPRRLQPTVPRDLETICLKCLRKEPRQRYATAQDLADDLRRFLAGESIRARPVGAGEQVVRWCRRKPAVAGLLAALVLASAAGLSGILWHLRSVQLHAIDLKRERDTARLEHARAERNLQRVREKVDRLARLGRDLWQDPRLYKTGKTVLEEALAFYNDILPEEGSDPRVRLETAQLYRQVAGIQHSLGQWGKAIEACRRQADLLAALLEEDPTNASYRLQLAGCHKFHGIVLHELDRAPQAREAYDRAAKLYEELLGESPDDADTQLSLANTLLNTAVLLSPRDHADELERLYDRMMELNRSGVKARPDRLGPQVELALGLEGQAMFLLATGRAAQALGMVREVLALRQKLLSSEALDRLFPLYVARAHANLAKVLLAVGQKGEAERELQAAMGLVEDAVKLYPDSPHYRVGLAKALLDRADLLKDPGRQGEAAEVRRRAIEVYAGVAADFPEDIQSRRRLGSLLMKSGRYAEAADQFRKALEYDPEDPQTNNDLAWALAATECDPRDAAEAVRVAEKAVAARTANGNYWNTLGAAHYRNGDAKAAVSALDKAMDLKSGGNGFDWFFLAMALHRLDDRKRAREWFERAVDWMAERRPKDDELRRIHAEAENTLAEENEPLTAPRPAASGD